MSVEDTLKARGSLYGEFYDQAEDARILKATIRDLVIAAGKDGNDPDDAENCFTPDMWEAIDMICTKLSRIINGDHNYADSWHDIAGYATLVANRLEKKEK